MLVVVHNTFVLERSFTASAEKVFGMLSDPAKKRRWYAEGGGGTDLEKYEMDFRVGGVERAESRFKAGSPFPGVAMVSDGVYLDIVPGKRVVMAQSMIIGDRRISAALATFEVVASAKGADLVFTHQAAFFEGSDGPAMREAGWRSILDRIEVS